MKRRFSGFVAIIMALVMLLSAMSFAEELGEVDLYAPEIYEGEVTLETPLDEPEQALEPDVQIVAEEASAATDAIKEEAPATVEIIEENSLAGEPVEYAVAAPALEPMAVTQTVALTGKKAKVQMNVGDSLQITLNEGETGKFTSKKAKLATVDANGLVTALKKGKAKITFKPTKGKARTLTIKIVDPYEPTGISISHGKTVTVNLGDSLQLGAVLSPGTARTTLTWSSSKKKNASVNASGTVTALKEGSTKITVKTANKKKATITIKVVDPYKPTGVSITQGKSATLNVGETLQLSATLSPSTAQSGLTWKSSKTKVAKVDANGLVTAVGKGTAKITVTTRNGKKATCKVTVNVIETVGVIDLSVYYNLDIHKAAKEIGGLKHYNWNGEDGITDEYSNGSIYLFGDKTISSIRFVKESPYNLLGIQIGMSNTEAKDRMKVYSLKQYSDSTYIVGYTSKKNEIWMYVSYGRNGFVDEIMYGQWA